VWFERGRCRNASRKAPQGQGRGKYRNQQHEHEPLRLRPEADGVRPVQIIGGSALAGRPYSHSGQSRVNDSLNVYPSHTCPTDLHCILMKERSMQENVDIGLNGLSAPSE